MGDDQLSQEEEDSKEVAITYDTLFELLRREKSRDELQELQPTFFRDVIKYLESKNNILSSQKSELFATDEKEKTLIELQNIKKILRELYDRREKKIITLAINKARTSSSLIDTSALLKEEKGIFESLCRILESYRNSVLENVIEARPPEAAQEESKGDSPAAKGGSADAETQETQPHASQAEDDEQAREETGQQGQALNTSSEEQKKGAEKPDKVKVRFLSPVPQFVGPELEVYGPFEEEETAELPREIVNVLLEKGRAVTCDSDDTNESGE